MLTATVPVIPFAEPDISELEITAVVEVLRSGWITTGPKATELEGAFAALTGKFSLAFSSATSAQLCGMRAWLDLYKIPPGSEVLVSGLTFASTVINCLHLDLVPVFCDVDPDTLQPTVATLREARARAHNPVAVIVTHYGGYPCSMDSIWDWCKVRRLFLIDDAAHCLPTRYKQWQAGAWPSDLTFFSFYATKTVCCAEGGLAAFKDEALAKLARQYRLHGITRSSFDRYVSTTAYWDYDIDVLGYKANLPDILAALALAQWTRSASLQARRRHIWTRYTEHFGDRSDVITPWEDSRDVEQSCHLYPLRVGTGRDALMRAVRAAGVVCSLHFKPFYRMSVWKGEVPSLPVLDEFWQSAVSLPVYSKMTEGQVTRVIEAVDSALG